MWNPTRFSMAFYAILRCSKNVSLLRSSPNILQFQPQKFCWILGYRGPLTCFNCFNLYVVHHLYLWNLSWPTSRCRMAAPQINRQIWSSTPKINFDDPSTLALTKHPSQIRPFLGGWNLDWHLCQVEIASIDATLCQGILQFLAINEEGRKFPTEPKKKYHILWLLQGGRRTQSIIIKSPSSLTQAPNSSWIQFLRRFQFPKRFEPVCLQDMFPFELDWRLWLVFDFFRVSGGIGHTLTVEQHGFRMWVKTSNTSDSIPNHRNDLNLSISFHLWLFVGPREGSQLHDSSWPDTGCVNTHILHILHLWFEWFKYRRISTYFFGDTDRVESSFYWSYDCSHSADLNGVLVVRGMF